MRLRLIQTEVRVRDALLIRQTTIVALLKWEAFAVSAVRTMFRGIEKRTRYCVEDDVIQSAFTFSLVSREGN